MEENIQEKSSETGGVNEQDVNENKAMAAIAYLGILFLIPLLAKKDSPFAQYHAKQGMILFIVWVVASFVIWIPILGWIMGILLFVLFIIGIVNVLGGKMKPLPVIGSLADKFKF